MGLITTLIIPNLMSASIKTIYYNTLYLFIFLIEEASKDLCVHCGRSAIYECSLALSVILFFFFFARPRVSFPLFDVYDPIL